MKWTKEGAAKRHHSVILIIAHLLIFVRFLVEPLLFAYVFGNTSSFFELRRTLDL